MQITGMAIALALTAWGNHAQGDVAASSAQRRSSPVLQLPGAPEPRQRAGGPAELVEAVKIWNDNIVRFGTLAATSPPNEARINAMGSTTVHDVLNAVQRRFAPYAYDGVVDRPLSVEAAIATGAYEVLAGITATPAAQDFIRQAYADYMATLDPGDEVTRGVQLGHDAAAAMLARRAGDGSAGPPVSQFTSTGEPGRYRPTVKASPDGLTGLQSAVSWGAVRPFVVTSGSQFRARPPYGAPTVEAAVRTPRYLEDYAEVKRLGGMVSERTQDQTDIGVFWIESNIRGWNRIARVLGDQRHLDAWRLARLTAHVSLAIADAYIDNFESKYLYNFWRPVTAIRLGNLDPATPGDPAWDVASMSFPGLGATPPIPEYNSAHAMAGAAAGEVIVADLGGPLAFTVESPTLPGKPRSFGSISQAVEENADSRVFIGFHFREATISGNQEGRKVGQWVAAHSLQPVRGEGDE